MVFCESRTLCPAFGVMSPQVVSSLLKLRESDLPALPLFIPLRRIIGDWCCSLHRGDVNYSGTSTSSAFSSEVQVEVGGDESGHVMIGLM